MESLKNALSKRLTPEEKRLVERANSSEISSKNIEFELQKEMEKNQRQAKQIVELSVQV